MASPRLPSLPVQIASKVSGAAPVTTPPPPGRALRDSGEGGGEELEGGALEEETLAAVFAMNKMHMVRREE